MPHDPDTLKPSPITPWLDYTDSQRAAILEMVNWQDSQVPTLSDRKFCAGSPYTDTTWSRLKRGLYLGKVDEAIRSFQRHIVTLSEARLKARIATRQKYFKTTDAELLEEAIKNAQADAMNGGQDKCVFYVGDFGSGKTTLATKLCDDYNGVLIEAMPSWKNSYFAACQNIAEAVGLRKQFIGAANAERELLAHLKLRPRTIFFEEVEYTGTQLLNLWKMIVNQTECVVVVFFITRFFNELRRRGGEYADQLLRRTDVIIARAITASMAGKFLLEYWPKFPEIRPCAQAIADAANKKGSMHLCASVARMLHQEFGKECPGLKDVEAKIESYRLMKQYSTSTVGA